MNSRIEKARILVVALKDAERESLVSRLRRAGHDVIEAANGADCLREAESGSYHLILLHSQLPGLSGIEVCRRLKQSDQTADIPVILVGGSSPPEGASGGEADSGPDAFLPGAPESAELISLVKVLLRLRTSESARLQSDRRFNTHFENNPDPFFSVDAQGKFTHVNSACVDLSGYSRAELLEMNFFELCPPDHRDRTLAAFQEGLQGRPAHKLETALIRKNGERVELLIAGSALVVRDQAIEIYCTAKDITERKRAEEALRQNEEQLRVALSAGQMGTWVLDTTTGMVLTDAFHRLLWDIEGDQALVPAELILSRIIPEDRDLFVPPQDLTRISGPLDLEFRIRRRDGEVRWLHGAAVPMPDATGTTRKIVGVNFDITQQKSAQEKLRHNEQRLRLAVDAAFLVSFEWDIQRNEVRRFVSKDPALLPTPEDAPVTYESVCRIVHPEDLQSFHSRVQLALSREDGHYENEFRIIRPDGSIAWLYERGRIERDSLGKPVRLIGLSQDITARKRAEETLRESEEQFRAMFTVASIGKAQADPETGRLLRVNHAFCQITGRSEEELLRCRMSDITHPDDREKDWEFFVKMVKGESTSYESEKRYVCPDGKVVWVQVSANLIRDAAGRPYRTAAIIQDITARKQAEKALFESEQRLRLAKTAGQIGIHDYNPITGELHWDDRLRELWGLAPDALVDYQVFISGVHPDDRNAVNEAVQRALDPAGNGRCDIEYRLVQGDCTRWISATGDVTFDKGRAVRLVGTAQDITERKEFQAELERLVAERTARLQELVGELEHFSYTITHDMRAPLRAMRGFSELVQEMCAPCPHQEQKKLLGRITASAERMDLLITDALSYSKAVRQDLPLGPVDVGKLIRGMLDSYPEFQTCIAHIDLEGEIPPVLGNQAGLTQCFSNLLGNAVKFVSPGTVPRIRIWAEQVSGTTPSANASQPASHWIRIWVEDNGIGISPIMLPRIFNMFSRGSTQYGGNGVGLALVRKVVDRMGGRVGVESEVGKGSRFWVELQPGDPRQRPPAFYPAPPPDVKTIL